MPPTSFAPPFEQSTLNGFSPWQRFNAIAWNDVPDEPGVYAISEPSELLYVGMAGRDGKGSLRRRLKDHASGQVVNMFAQYLFFAKAQFLVESRVRHPIEAKQLVQQYVREHCSLAWRVCMSATEARAMESDLRRQLVPSLNGTQLVESRSSR